MMMKLVGVIKEFSIFKEDAMLRQLIWIEKFNQKYMIPFVMDPLLKIAASILILEKLTSTMSL